MRYFDRESKAVGTVRRPSCFCQHGSHQSSEDHAGGELEVARAAAAEEWVADAYVGRDGDGQEADASARQGVYAVEGGVRREARQQGRGEVRVVEEVENLGAQLELNGLAEVCRLEEGEVEVSVAGACERVASETSEVLR